MPFYEVIFETGSNSVAEYANDEEALAANQVHHDRARNGMTGGPTGHAAERVVDILKYDRHPADFGVDQAFSKDVAGKTVTDLINELADENGVVSKTELAAAIVSTSEAIIPTTERMAGKSLYKMKEKASLDLPWAEGSK